MNERRGKFSSQRQVLFIARSEFIARFVQDAVPDEFVVSIVDLHHAAAACAHPMCRNVHLVDATDDPALLPEVVQTLRACNPAVPIVVLCTCSAGSLHALARVVVDQTLIWPCSPATLRDALACATQSTIDAFIEVLRVSGRNDMVIQAVELALRAPRPFGTEKRWRTQVGMSHSTFWRKWHEAVHGVVTARDFLVLIALQRVIAAVDSGLSLEQGLELAGISHGRLQRAARKLGAESVSDLAIHRQLLEDRINWIIDQVMSRRAS